MERWTKVAMVGIVVLGAIGGVAALRATCADDIGTHTLTVKLQSDQPTTYFELDNDTFSRLPFAGQEIIRSARNRGLARADWDEAMNRTVQMLRNASEQQTGDPFVPEFEWDDAFYLYGQEAGLPAPPIYCL